MQMRTFFVGSIKAQKQHGGGKMFKKRQNSATKRRMCSLRHEIKCGLQADLQVVQLHQRLNARPKRQIGGEQLRLVTTRARYQTMQRRIGCWLHKIQNPEFNKA